MLCDPIWQMTPHCSEMTGSGELYRLTVLTVLAAYSIERRYWFAEC